MQVEVRGSASLMRKLAALGDVAAGKALERALVSGALIVQNDAKIKAPYLTGNLRRSIHIGGHADLAPDRTAITQITGIVPEPKHAPAGVTVYVGTDVEYGPILEYGSGRRTARPFLRPALDENEAAVRREIGEALHDLIQAATR